MKLHKVEIRNFRCFGAFRVDLVPDVTIFIGKNGSGKSTLIHAIKYGLSFIFSKDKKVNPNGQSFSASAKGLDMIAFTTTDAKYNMEKHDYCYPVSILCNATDTDSSSFGWGLIKENIDKPVSHENYEHAYKRFKDKSEYPVIAIYSDSFPHVESKITRYAQAILSSGNPIPMNFGYYQWGTDTACTEVWERRFINVWKEILNKTFYAKNKDSVDVLEKEKNTITNYLKKFSNPIFDRPGNDEFCIEDISVTTRDKKDYLLFHFKNGEDIQYNNLPSGYRRLFSIVLDVAYRAYLLQLRSLDNPLFPDFTKEPDEVTGVIVMTKLICIYTQVYNRK